jgi:hypothetical protein
MYRDSPAEDALLVQVEPGVQSSSEMTANDFGNHVDYVVETEDLSQQKTPPKDTYVT